MATVRQIVQDLVDGVSTVGETEARLVAHTRWDLGGEPTEAQLYGVEDIPPAGDDSPDQIDLVGQPLSRSTRGRLWAAASAANDGTALVRRRWAM